MLAETWRRLDVAVAYFIRCALVPDIADDLAKKDDRYQRGATLDVHGPTKSQKLC